MNQVIAASQKVGLSPESRAIPTLRIQFRLAILTCRFGDDTGIDQLSLGTAKEKVGQVTNNPDLAAEGQAERIAGVVQKKVGQIEKVLEN
jgi:uncharacterized protein YjbJ (UPF0337 family)